PCRTRCSTLFPYTTLFRSKRFANPVARVEPAGGTLSNLPVICRTDPVHSTTLRITKPFPATLEIEPSYEWNFHDPDDPQGSIFEDRKSTRLNSSHDQISYA